jgi:uncharacterized protein (TIGR02265 family)
MRTVDRNRTAQENIQELCRHSDLSERLALVPPSVKVRGIYFRTIERVLGDAGRREAYDTLFPQRFSAVLWHPAEEFLVRLVSAGALLTDPAHVYDGMFEIGRRNAVMFAESLLGRTLLRLLDRDPKKLMQQALAGSRQSCTHSRWKLEFPDDRSAVVTMLEEYLYMDSWLLGAARGTFEAVGATVRTEVLPRDKFSGQHIHRW